MRRILKIIVLILLTTGPLAAEDSFAYKLAILHTRFSPSSPALTNPSNKPASATVAEFKWILDSLKKRCINDELTLADTIVQTWNVLRQNGQKRTLLETARELSQTARNILLFGNEKVNFQMTSKAWLASQLSNIPITEILSANAER